MKQFDAVIFDLDGVITQTAKVHGTAWKKMFDEYLHTREKRFNEPFKEFTHEGDYLPYVDGKPRYKGVESFMESRGIDIPFGNPEDSPDMETVCGLGNAKNKFFNEVLKKDGAEVFESTVSLIYELKNIGVRIGVASSSKNCKQILQSVNLLDLFETRVDGVVSAELGLMGKPEPDIFTTACDNLGVDYHRTVIVEDAVSGVQAGLNGGFGLTLGLAREDNTTELLINGADIVVEDLSEISIDTINEWFNRGLENEKWTLNYHDYNPENERSREALLAIGNGFFGTRGAMEESKANKINYPGTYIAGLFNRLVSKVAGRDIENEDFVNNPNWLPVNFKPENGDWLSFGGEPNFEIEKIHRKLDFRTGLLTRYIIIKDKQGKRTEILSKRFASMDNPHIAGISYEVSPINYQGPLLIRSGLFGDHINAGVERYQQLKQKHLEPVLQIGEKRKISLVVKTINSGVTIAQNARHDFLIDNKKTELECNIESGKGWVAADYNIHVEKGQKIILEKLVSIHTSQDKKKQNPLVRAEKDIKSADSWNGMFERSVSKWEKLWDNMDIIIDHDRNSQKLVRLHLYHMLVTASEHFTDQDAGIPPRGLHGEAYRGHIFWDELYILPLYNIHMPGVTKASLMYRYRRLDKAREYAKEYGYKGAMFPWQSGSDGREETQIIHLNPLSGEWGDDYSSLQRHISIALAYNVWNYFAATRDEEFMINYGVELYFEICRFWASKAKFNSESDRYSICKVMGPDEFHEKHTGSEEGGIKNNAYTNIMVSWLFKKVESLCELLPGDKMRETCKKLGFEEEEMQKWQVIRKKLKLEISGKGIIAQFEGYFKLKDLDWDYYRKKYKDIHRLDRILKAEGKSPDDYKLSKQADLLMLYYNLDKEEVEGVVEEMGYKLPDNYFEANFDYYINRTTHGSTLSRLVHAYLANLINRKKLSMQLFQEALTSDYVDIQGGTTGEGIHCGVMAGTVYSVLNSYAGVNLRSDVVKICPKLPGSWDKIKFGFKFRDEQYQLVIGEKEIEILIKSPSKKKINIHLCGKEFPIPVNVNKKLGIN
ncbi:MAG: HAD-IA family hydrolase [Bacteroidetes bacterium]|nr:HAD-IA family hydrolase [Bacteroidota bacterium]